MATTTTVSASSVSTTFAHVSGVLSYIIDEPIKQRLSGQPLAVRFQSIKGDAEHCRSRLNIPLDVTKPDPLPRGVFDITFKIDNERYQLNVHIDETDKIISLSLMHDNSPQADSLLRYIQENYRSVSENAAGTPTLLHFGSV